MTDIVDNNRFSPPKADQIADTLVVTASSPTNASLEASRPQAA